VVEPRKENVSREFSPEFEAILERYQKEKKI